METEKKKRCPKGMMRNKQGECVVKPAPKAPKAAKSPSPVEKTPSPVEKSPVAAATTKKRCPKGMTRNKQGICMPNHDKTLKKYTKILEERRKCIQLHMERLK
jgi:hypothetical protein